MAEKKKTSYRWLLLHGVMYAACMATALFALVCLGGVAYSHNLLWMGVLMSASHIVIDFVKIATKLGHTKWGFVTDQAAHILVLILAWLLFGREFTVGSYIHTHFHHIAIVLGLLCLLRPVGLLLESGFIWDFGDKNAEHQEETHKKDSQKNASRMIGYLERIVAYFLLLNGQYSTIALVIAAKSIARFPEIRDPESKMQANQYIIGTFLSLTAVFAVTVFVRFIS